MDGHAARPRDRRAPGRRAGAARAPPGRARDGGQDLRHRAGLADGEALGPRHVRPGPGRVYPGRRGKLAAGAAAEIRPAAGAVDRRGQRDAALRPRLFRRLGQLPAGEVAAGHGGHPRRRSTACATSWSTRRSWPRPRSRRRSSGSSTARRCSRRRRAWGAVSWRPQIRYSTRPMRTTSRR